MKAPLISHLLLAFCLLLSTSAMAFCDVSDLQLEYDPATLNGSHVAPSVDTHAESHAHHCHGHMIGDLVAGIFISTQPQTGTRHSDIHVTLHRLSYPPLNPPPNT